jgi:hypothetical protein
MAIKLLLLAADCQAVSVMRDRHLSVTGERIQYPTGGSIGAIVPDG